MLVSLIGFVTAPLIYPIAYILRNVKLFRRHLLYYYYDDEDGYYGTEWFRESSGYKLEGVFWFDKFVCAYHWSALRNPAWNLQASLTPKQGAKFMVDFNGKLTKNGERQRMTEMAVLKYVNFFGHYMDNKGEFLSLQYSIIGSMFLWYEIDDTMYWRYSLAKNVYKNYWLEVHLGTNDRRYTWRLKLKKNKIYLP